METEKVKLEISSTFGGEALGAGNYELASTVELKALPIEGYVFVHWQDESGNILSTNAYYTFTINVDTKVSATFAIKKFSVRLSTTGDGIGTVSGAGEYDLSSTVPVEAVAGANSVFVAWLDKDENVVSTLNQHVFVIESDTELVARFDIVKHNITASTKEGGTVSGAGKYSHGSTATLTANPSEGYKFEKWTNDAGVQLSTNSTYSFTANSDRNFTAVFKKKMYTVKFKYSQYSRPYSLSVNGSNIVWNKEYTYEYGTILAIKGSRSIVGVDVNGTPNPAEPIDSELELDSIYYVTVIRDLTITIIF